MEYTEKEKVTIAIATCCAFVHLEDASNLLHLFWENYCESLEILLHMKQNTGRR